MRIGIFYLLVLGLLFAETPETDKIKHMLLTNMMHTYSEEPTDVESIQDMFMKGFNGDSNIYLKLRYAHVMGEDDTPLPGFADKYKADPSYDELRLEVNYLF